MTDTPPVLIPQFEDDRLVLTKNQSERGSYSLICGRTEDSERVSLSFAEALHARIHPLGTAETVLRAWANGVLVQEETPLIDPTSAAPVRVRAGAVVLRHGHMLLIELREGDDTYYEIPGGGVEAGETLHEAVIRELREESGLSAGVVQEVAQVWKGGRREHYFLLEAGGELGTDEELDNHGGTPVWVPVSDLAAAPVWPRRLAWRIAHWYRAGWPTEPAQLADGIHDLKAPCTW
ncbi:hypothetical protein GCM10022384_59580 [Streptomyces marokkonensis]|uniref:Nudix hydrolase domain-containing protein n=1 Tax=Streptomyces marokkonensis TaxID=324855 RepID=A0ABP7S279_9ACTN